MEWIERLNQAVDYIEENLDGEIKPEKAAQLAACSVFHFQRMFAYITGVTLNEYIRRRRMTTAAFELVDGGAKVIDLAVKYGYDSPTAFNRAFRNVHGVSPSQAKIEGIRLTSFPRITFTMSIKGEKAMNFRIVKKDAFRIVGYPTQEPGTMEDCFVELPKFWDRVRAMGGIDKLRSLARSKEAGGILGVCISEHDGSSKYFIAAATDAPVPEGMEEYLVPAATYAVFECVGPVPGAIQEAHRRILSEWLPSSGYQYSSAADIEVYPAGDMHSADYRCETWLPIVK